MLQVRGQNYARLCGDLRPQAAEQSHLAMIEHVWMSYRIVCDRGVTHEIVRHRLFSYAQESTRYCNYKGGVTFVIPPWVDFVSGDYSFFPPLLGTTVAEEWAVLLLKYEDDYLRLLNRCRWSPQQAPVGVTQRT